MALVGDTVVLNGTGSYDPDGDEVTYEWSQVEGPYVTLKHADSAQPSFEVQSEEMLTFELTVSDGTDQSDPDQVDVGILDDEDDKKGCGCTAAKPGQGTFLVLILGLLSTMVRTRRPESRPS